MRPVARRIHEPGNVAPPSRRTPAPPAHTTSQSPPAHHTEPPDAAQTSWPWVVIETLADPDQPTMVLDGGNPRAFSRLTRASIARNHIAARLLGPLVHDCVSTAQTHEKAFTLPDDRVQRIIGVPVLGPSGHVHAVAVWAGGIEEALPRMPIIGAIEWNISGLISASPAAEFLLRTTGPELSGQTIPELLAEFETFDDRASFLALFNLAGLDVPAEQWIGTATKTYGSDDRHDLFLAARAVGTGDTRVVRAVVTDITGTDKPRTPDLALVAVRHMPIPAGHALGLVDLKTGFCHEWLTEPNSPLASWRHHNPSYSEDDRAQVRQTCFELAMGVKDTATVRVRIRFSEQDEWILLEAIWTRILDGDRPQALLDVTPLSEIPTPVVSGCQLCRDIADRQTGS
ncbi:GAF domain-containing protein [Nocardia sp. IFM 10818]